MAGRERAAASFRTGDARASRRGSDKGNGPNRRHEEAVAGSGQWWAEGRVLKFQPTNAILSMRGTEIFDDKMRDIAWIGFGARGVSISSNVLTKIRDLRGSNFQSKTLKRLL